MDLLCKLLAYPCSECSSVLNCKFKCGKIICRINVMTFIKVWNFVFLFLTGAWRSSGKEELSELLHFTPRIACFHGYIGSCEVYIKRGLSNVVFSVLIVYAIWKCVGVKCCGCSRDTHFCSQKCFLQRIQVYKKNSL